MLPALQNFNLIANPSPERRRVFKAQFIHSCFLLLSLSLNPCFSQNNNALLIPAKTWGRDSLRNIVISDWRSYLSTTVEMVPGFRPVSKVNADKYGGDAASKAKATGFFRTEKQGNRWWVIDPEGHHFVTAAVNSVRMGKSPNNELSLKAKFGTPEEWLVQTAQLIRENDFNVIGAWSEVELIQKYNILHPEKPIVYTTMLSFMGEFSKRNRKKGAEKENSLSLLFDPAFQSFCDEHARNTVLALKSDKNLLGHFSDNELAFSTDFLAKILAKTDKTSPDVVAAKQWLSENKIDEKTITKAQNEAFLGYVSDLYYREVAKALKKYDPDHLYIGSRLHSSGKHVQAILKAAEKYVDIVSINYYGHWQPSQKHISEWAEWCDRPFFITEFYTKAEDSGMENKTGAGWLVKTQTDRGIHYQNFCLELLKAPNCVGWHWFRYQDNDPTDLSADESNRDSNKGMVSYQYTPYVPLLEKMKVLNLNKYELIKHFDKK
jgi:hypothetical protein